MNSSDDIEGWKELIADPNILFDNITPETETKQLSYNNLKKEYSVFSFVLCVFYMCIINTHFNRKWFDLDDYCPPC